MRGVVLAALLLVGGSGAALAHAQLRGASPAAGEVVTASPPEVVLDFSEGVEPALCTIEVQDGGGLRVDGGNVHGAPGNPKRLAVGLKRLAPGAYKVIWHAVSVDTHRTEGSFTFTVGP